MTNSRRWIAVALAALALSVSGCAKKEVPPQVQLTGNPDAAIPPTSSTTTTSTTAAPPTTLYYG